MARSPPLESAVPSLLGALRWASSSVISAAGAASSSAISRGSARAWARRRRPLAVAGRGGSSIRRTTSRLGNSMISDPDVVAEAGGQVAERGHREQGDDHHVEHSLVLESQRARRAREELLGDGGGDERHPGGHRDEHGEATNRDRPVRSGWADRRQGLLSAVATDLPARSSGRHCVSPCAQVRSGHRCRTLAVHVRLFL